VGTAIGTIVADGAFVVVGAVVVVTDAFVTSMTANAGVVHGPFRAAEAADRIAAIACERAGGRAIALATGDQLLATLDLPGALRGRGATVVVPTDPAWADALAGAGTGVTGAVAAVAETGSVAVACGPGSPRATSLVPAAHVCVVAVDDVVADLATALDRLAAVGLPSNLVWISGPSRTGDIEMTITMGVHGPVSVDVVLVDTSA
jgi:L-lactate dehydrogenase complex protein LldG